MKVHIERDWLHKINLGDDCLNYETDEELPRLSTLFGTSNQAARVIFLETGIEKYFRNGHHLDENGIKYFKSRYIFDNKHFEVSDYCLNGQKVSHQIRFL